MDAFPDGCAFVATEATAQQTPPQRVTLNPARSRKLWRSTTKDCWGTTSIFLAIRPDLGKWNNSISSMGDAAGRWEFFDEEKFQGTKTELGPGMYLNVKDHGINDNSISSIRLVGSLTAR